MLSDGFACPRAMRGEFTVIAAGQRRCGIDDAMRARAKMFCPVLGHGVQNHSALG